MIFLTMPASYIFPFHFTEFWFYFSIPAWRSPGGPSHKVSKTYEIKHYKDYSKIACNRSAFSKYVVISGEICK